MQGTSPKALYLIVELTDSSPERGVEDADLLSAQVDTTCNIDTTQERHKYHLEGAQIRSIQARAKMKALTQPLKGGKGSGGHAGREALGQHSDTRAFQLTTSAQEQAMTLPESEGQASGCQERGIVDLALYREGDFEMENDRFSKQLLGGALSEAVGNEGAPDQGDKEGTFEVEDETPEHDQVQHECILSVVADMGSSGQLMAAPLKASVTHICPSFL